MKKEYVFCLRDGWHVMWQGRVCSPVWMERGPAEAYLDLLRSGYRQPEYSR